MSLCDVNNFPIVFATCTEITKKCLKINYKLVPWALQKSLMTSFLYSARINQQERALDFQLLFRF